MLRNVMITKKCQFHKNCPNGNCTINLQIRPHLHSTLGQGLMIILRYRLIKSPAKQLRCQLHPMRKGAELGERGRARTLVVQLPLAINEIFSSILRNCWVGTFYCTYYWDLLSLLLMRIKITWTIQICLFYLWYQRDWWKTFLFLPYVRCWLVNLIQLRLFYITSLKSQKLIQISKFRTIFSEKFL